MNIPLFEIFTTKSDIARVASVIKRGNYWATGPEISEFEKEIAKYIGMKYCVIFNSGTSALHSTLIAFNIGLKDQVIVPSFTYISAVNAVLFVNAKPVFAEIEEKSFALELNDVKKKINKRTKAVLLTHYGGCPSINTTKLKQLAKKHNLYLLEDCAESFGARIGKKMVGSFGNAGIFSFCHNKIITTGEGGAVTTDSENIYKKLRQIRSLGKSENKLLSDGSKKDYIVLGFNFRMSSINAALGLSQIKNVEKIIKARRKIGLQYNSNLEIIKELNLAFKEIPDNFYPVYQMFTLKTSTNLRNKLMKYLLDKGVQVEVYFEPVHLTTLYKNLNNKSTNFLPITEKVSKEVLSIPIYPTLTSEKRKYITIQIKKFFNKNNQRE